MRDLLKLKMSKQRAADPTKFQPSSQRLVFESAMAQQELSRPNWKLIGGVTVGVVSLGAIVFFLRK